MGHRKTTMGDIAVSILGSVAVHRDGTESSLQAGQRKVLALLVAAGARGLTPDRLADEIWLDELPTQWRSAVRVAISRLRSRNGLAVCHEHGRYVLDLEPERIDARRLLDAADAGPIDDELIDLAVETEVMPTVDVSPLLAQLDSAIRDAQRRILVRLAGTAGAVSLSDEQRRRLARRRDHDPDDAQLAEAIGTLLDPPSDARLRPVPASTEPVARRAGRDAVVGRDDELDRLVDAIDGDHRVVIVRGPTGIGKSTLLHLLAARLDTRVQGPVWSGAASSTSPTAYGALVAAVPGFAAALQRIAPEQYREVALAILADAFLDALAGPGRGRPLLLVDDAQWLDGQSAALLDLLSRFGTDPRTPTIVLAARPATGDRTPWSDLEVELARGDHRVVEVGPLGGDAIVELVAARRPGLSLAARAQLARRLQDRSGGVPAVITALLADDDGADTPPGGGPGEVFARIVAATAPEVRLVGGAAAVLGPAFDLSQVVTVTGLDENQVLSAIEVLLDRALVVETDSLDRFRFDNQLASDAFLRALSTARRARFHATCATITDDVHELARHLVRADRLANREEAAAAMVASARAHLADRAYWEAADELREARSLVPPESTGPQILVDQARALSLTGSRSAARGVRRQAFDQAVAVGRWDLAHDAAVSGLPETESPDGEPDRYQDLISIHPARLDPERRFSQATVVARQATLLGQAEAAQRWATMATALAKGDRQRVRAALSYRFATTTLEDPAERHATLARAIDGIELTVEEGTRIEQFRALDLLEQGRLDEAVGAHRSFEALADRSHDPVRQWHAALFGSLLAEMDGRWDDADSRAAEALAIGRRAGIDQADITRRSQLFFRLLVAGKAGAMAAGLDDVPSIDRESLLFLAARARILGAAGRRDDAVGIAESVAYQALHHRSASTLGCLAIAAPLLVGSDPALRRRAVEAFEPFADAAIVIGVGLGLVGPVDLLTDDLIDGTDPVASRERAVAWADDRGIRLWQVTVRLDLAHRTGSAAIRAEAARRAGGTDLVRLLAGRDRPDRRAAS